MKVYTKIGDGGRTQLLGGVDVAKTDARIDAIGEVDELNASVGLARVVCEDPLLEKVQCWLFDLGAELACPPGGKFDLVGPGEAEALELEAAIDAMSEKLPPLKNFILPGGDDSAARLHLTRCICRRAERALLRLNEESPLRAESLVFMNRLSDWLFVAAREANSSRGVADVPWQKLKRD